MDIVVGVDIGTTSVKVLAATPEGETVATAEAKYQLFEPSSGYKEQNPHEIIENVEQTIKNALRQLNDNHLVKGFSFSSAMHSIIAVDEQGRPLTRAIIWADKRSSDYAEKLRNQDLGKEIYQHTGAPIHAMLPLCKIAWLKDHQPDVFRQAHKFVSIKELLFYHWFNEYVIDYSIAGATGFFDSNALQWCDKALEFAHIQAHQLSKPVPTNFIIKADQQLAERFAIPVQTPFIIGASDGCLANLNASGLDAKRATLTLGTSGAIRITVDEFDQDDQMRVFNYILTDRYRVIGGPTNNGGNVLDFVMDRFFPDIEDYEVVLGKLANIPVGSHGLVCVPYFSGERAPLWDARVVGNFYGVQSLHNRNHFGRAALEGMIFNLFLIAQGLQAAALTEIHAIQADGGMTRSPMVVQMIADVFNKPVYLTNGSHGTDRGAVLLGAYTLGLRKTLDDKATDDEVIQPIAENHQVLQQNYQQFVRLVNNQRIMLAESSNADNKLH